MYKLLPNGMLIHKHLVLTEYFGVRIPEFIGLSRQAPAVQP